MENASRPPTEAIDMEVDAGIPFTFDEADELTRHIIDIYFYNFEWNDRIKIFDMLRNSITIQLEMNTLGEVSETDSEDENHEPMEAKSAGEPKGTLDSDTDNEAYVENGEQRVPADSVHTETDEDGNAIVSPYTKQWIDAMDLFTQTRSLWEEFGTGLPFITFSQFFGDVIRRGRED